MDATTGGRRPTKVVLWLTGILVLAGCRDGVGPGPVPVEGARADEVVLDQAAADLESMGREMAAEAEGEWARERQRARDGVGGMRDRHRVRDHAHRLFLDRAGLAVELGGTAVALSARILDEGGADPEQLRLQEAAEEAQRGAEAALAAGDVGRAVSLATQACWTALKAVVLPGGVTAVERRQLLDLAATSLEAAREAVAEGGGPAEEALLRWAGHFFEMGTAHVTGGNARGVAALWKAAVVSIWIVG